VLLRRSGLLASFLVTAAICLIISRSDALIAVSTRVRGKGLLSTCKSKSTPFVYEEDIDRSTTRDFLSQVDVTVERVLRSACTPCERTTTAQDVGYNE
jgi:hypothetical protein